MLVLMLVYSLLNLFQMVVRTILNESQNLRISGTDFIAATAPTMKTVSSSYLLILCPSLLNFVPQLTTRIGYLYDVFLYH
jgi:hypothetical protein